MKGVFAICWNPRKWRLGLEHTYEENGKRWTWIVIGPFAMNLGAF